LTNGDVIYLDSVNNGQIALQNNVEVMKMNDGAIVYHAKEDKGATATSYNTLTNPRGSKVIDMALADGSHVWLNAGSSITFPVVFTGNERKVSIVGEAYFEVAHDEAKPFYVTKGEMEVKVLGTHFNVNAYNNEEDIRVTLLEGSVQVSRESAVGSQESRIIKPGEQALVNTSTIQLVNPNLDAVMAWKNGLFQFESADVKTVMRQLERWYDIDVRYEGNVPDIRFGGEMKRDLSLAQALRGLEKMGLHFRIEGNQLMILEK
jgi:ferric-dicitrate binding protein FerR (iron transport regulator)